MCNGVKDCVDGTDEDEVLCKLFYYWSSTKRVGDYLKVHYYADESGHKLFYFCAIAT